jgi:hypothetical protein
LGLDGLRKGDPNVSKRFGRIGLIGALFGVVMLWAAVLPAGAADLHGPHVGSSCDGDGVWHFVHNQAPNGTEDAYLTINGGAPIAADKGVANGKVWHWTVETSGSVTLADVQSWTSDDGQYVDLPGKLVLSDLDCTTTTTSSSSSVPPSSSFAP